MTRTHLVALMSFPRPRPTTNPYITQLAAALNSTDGLDVVFFSWRAALLSDYDVLHTHWPEILLDGRNGVRRAAKRLLVGLMCLRLTLNRKPVVRTWHNLERPAGLGRVDHVLLSWLDRLTQVRIRINDSTVLPDGDGEVTIPHGHYVDWFASFPRRTQVAGRIAFVGRIRPYKGVERLLETFHRSVDPSWSLVVSGLPSSAELSDVVTGLAAADPRVTLDLRYVDDATLVERVSESQVLVLPYRQMHNSGAALAGLSLGRPVLIPDNEVNRRLAAEVGPEWVYLFEGHLDQEDLRRALRSAASVIGQPDLSGRGWQDAGQAHLAAYGSALSRARGRGLLRQRGGD